MESVKKLFNFSTEDFTHEWDKVPYTVKAGESKIFPGFLADHLAKHLVTREMFREGKITESNDPNARQPFLDKCFTETEVVAENELEAQVKALNESEVPVKKPGRPKKDVSKEFEEIL